MPTSSTRTSVERILQDFEHRLWPVDPGRSDLRYGSQPTQRRGLPMTTRTTKTCFIATLASVLLYAPALASVGASLYVRPKVTAPHAPTKLCRVGRWSGVEARQLALTAEAAVVTIAAEHRGSYTRVSPRTIHSTEPSVPITRRAAAGGAYLLSASGTSDSYMLTVQASDGDTFSVRSDDGSITQSARECGVQRRW
jgi:hypothetical protein